LSALFSMTVRCDITVNGHGANGTAQRQRQRTLREDGN